MPLAINPQDGKAVYLTDQGAWEPAQTAVNPQTKQTLAYDGKSWSALPSSTTATEAFGRGAMNAATFNFYDELAGLGRAGGLQPDNPNPVDALKALGIGAYKKFTGDPEAQQLYNEQVARTRADTQQLEAEHPTASLSGNVTGAVALPVGGMLGAASLPARIGRSAAFGAGTGALSGLGAGEDAGSRAGGAVIGGTLGGALGAALPPVLSGIGALARPLTTTVRGVFNPEAEAARRIGANIERGVSADPNAVNRLTPQELAASYQQGGPAALIDVGGEATRGLARSAANTSPEAREILNQGINNRFETQSNRIAGWLNDAFNFPNAEAQQRALQQTARTTNRAAYGRAYEEGASGLWSPELERLAGSDAVSAAMQAAAKAAKDEAIVGGHGAMNPRITFTQDGRIQFNRGPNGVPTYPDLQFWDLARRELSDAAQRAGRGTSEARRLNNFATSLNAELDNLVPSYQQARAGAAHFFGAENALEAGQNFAGAGQRFGNREARTALGQMNPTERQLFQDGYVSRLIERINASPDRRNAVNQLMQSPAAREEIQIAIGRQRATQLEAGLRTERIMDMARGAVQGNSTTVRQWIEHGLAGGATGLGGIGVYNFDPREAGTAALVGGLALGSKRIDARVARRVAEMLSSSDPAALRRSVQAMAQSPGVMNALRFIDSRLARVGGGVSSNMASQQLQ